MLQILMGQLENLHVFIINLSFHAATAKIEFNGNFWEKSIIDVLNSEGEGARQGRGRYGVPSGPRFQIWSPDGRSRAVAAVGTAVGPHRGRRFVSCWQGRVTLPSLS